MGPCGQPCHLSSQHRLRVQESYVAGSACQSRITTTRKRLCVGLTRHFFLTLHLHTYSAYSGRNLREISFKGSQTTRIGRLPAFDYFGDGNLYLLDSPGHAVGHLCGLVRTTHGPDTFILLDGDVCHYAGIFRPSRYLPVPESI